MVFNEWMVDMQNTRQLARAERREFRLQLAETSEYQFLKCLERNPLGELWRVRDANGRHRLAQLLPPGENEAGLKRLQTLQTHRGLVPMEIASRDTAQPYLVMDFPSRTLGDRFQECWRQGQGGIPRAELLHYIRQAAETLDSLYLCFSIQHLALQPKYLVIHDGQLLVAGFGLAELFWASHQPQPYSSLNPRYAAPELQGQRIHSRTDQYSLALIYAELATGVHPLRGHGEKSTAKGKLDLALLSSGERDVLTKSLSAKPPDRFISIPDMVRALEMVGAGEDSPPPKIEPLGSVIDYSPTQLSDSSGLAPMSLDQFIADLVELAAGGQAQVREFHRIRYHLEAGQQLGHRFAIQHFPGAALLKLDGFRQQWKASLVHREEELLILSVHIPPSFWQALTGKAMGLEIHLHLGTPPGCQRGEVSVVIRPFGCGRQQAIRLLEDMGPRVLESLRDYLVANPEQRTNERLLCSQPLRVCPVIGGVELADPIECTAKDISADGIGFYLPRSMSAARIYVNMPGVPKVAALAGLAQVVRNKSCGDGWYEIGASFVRSPDR